MRVLCCLLLALVAATSCGDVALAKSPASAPGIGPCGFDHIPRMFTARNEATASMISAEWNGQYRTTSMPTMGGRPRAAADNSAICGGASRPRPSRRFLVRSRIPSVLMPESSAVRDLRGRLRIVGSWVQVRRREQSEGRAGHHDVDLHGKTSPVGRLVGRARDDPTRDDESPGFLPLAAGSA